MKVGKNKTKKQHAKKSVEKVSGRLEITRNGMGFVIVPRLSKDIMVRPDRMGLALDGDEVVVELIEEEKKGKRVQGIVVEVLKRTQTEFSGKLDVRTHFAFLIPDKQNMPVDIFVPLELLHGAVHGDKAIVKINEWTSKTKNPIGEVVSILTYESNNEIAMQGILVENGFPLSFPEEVMQEAENFSTEISKAEIKKRKDFRKILTVTIDPVDAKDFDDAISFQFIDENHFEVGVHIADVSHYLTPGTALDAEAYKRATSVYLPDRVLPMLPERLSNELCSLRPNEEKLTFSAVFKLNINGEVLSSWIGKTVIKSARRFTYEEVQTIIENENGELKDVILTLNSIAQNLRKERFKKGAINFSSKEVRFQLDENAKPIGIVIKESKEAHQLIEELMLLANREVATYISKLEIDNREIPFPYRVHDAPDVDKLKVFSFFASRFGHRFDLTTPQNIATSFNQMLVESKGKPEQQVLESLGIRTMAKAVYTTDNIGHYGLGFDNYCHFTSPIRRYPDVLVHRILFDCLSGNFKPTEHMEMQCRHCSEKERKAMEAERSANKYKQVEYMVDYVGEDFDAVISGVSGFGFWAETVAHKCEGMISINDLRDFDYYEFNEKEYALIGMSTGHRFSIGDKIKVKVNAANLEKRQIDFSLAEMTITTKKPTKTKRATNFDKSKAKQKNKRKS